jgi:hypothetical protein
VAGALGGGARSFSILCALMGNLVYFLVSRQVEKVSVMVLGDR